MNIYHLLRVFRHKRLIASDPLPNDIYIVEFPKSGITWLTTLLANIAVLSSGERYSGGFISSRMFIPDISKNKFIGPKSYLKPVNRMIKSHSIYNSSYPFVIYLARDPLDVMISYYFFQKAHCRFKLKFKDFIDSPRFGIDTWKYHVNSWLCKPPLGKPLILIKYEDLLESSFSVLQDVSTVLGWGLDDSVINTSIERSTIEVMQSQETLYQKLDPRHSVSFVNGVDADSKYLLKKEFKDYIYSTTLNERKILGYL